MAFRPLTASYADVVNLPANTATVSIPSKPIERLLAKREKGHNSTVNAIKLNCQKYSTEIEEEIRKESDRFTENFERIANEIQNELAIIIVPEDDILNLNLELFEDIISKVQDCNSRRLKTVDDFYEILKNLERKRSKHFKSVLNDGYKKTSKISHLLPYELLNFFDNEIVRLNELTMNNYYYYAKLHSDFKLQAQEDLRIALLKINEVREKFMMAVKVAKVKEVMDSHERASYDPTLPVLEIPNVDSLFTTDVPRSLSGLEAWTKGVKLTLNDLDVSAKKLLSLYKMAVVHVFKRFFTEMNTITDALTEDDGPKTVNVVENEDMYQTALEDITEKYTCNVAKLKKLWTSITEYMESNINKTHLFLSGSAHLWDDHFKRLFEIRKLMFADLDLIIEKNNKTAETFNMKINSSLDQLRQESTVPKLDLHLKDIYKYLETIEKLYQNQSESEIKVFEKYYFLIDQEIDLLISEIDRFLTENADKDIQEQKSCIIQHIEDNQEYKEPEDTESKLIPHQMKTCQFEVAAVNNWMFGLWEAIRCYMLTCRKEINEEADIRLANIISKIKKRLKVRLATLQPQYQTVKTMIYDVRLKEIQDHKDEYKRTTDRVSKLITESRNFNKISQADRMSIFDDFENKMRAIEDKLKKATKSQQVGVCIEMYKKLSQEINQLLVKSFDQNYEVLEKNLDNINKTIWSFIEAIKLFPDGGNYSRDEAKIYRKKITKLKKQTPKKYKKVLDEYNRLKPQIMIHLNQTDVAVLKRMDLFQKEFKHNETICEKINDLRLKIRNSAYDIKFKIHRVDADIDYYEEMSKINIWKRKHFDIMKEAVDDCLQKIITLTMFLTGDNNTNGNDYLFELNQMIDDSYLEIGNIAEEFYRTHGMIINKEKIQKTYNDFMREVKKNYDGFKIQVEIHCSQCVTNLINHILKLLKVNDRIFEDLVKKFPDIKCSDSEELKNELSENLSHMSTNLEENTRLLAEKKTPVEEIILKNKKRVNVLQSMILKLMEHISSKVTAMEEVVEEDDENEETVDEAEIVH